MDANERFARIATAPAGVLAKIDNILNERVDAPLLVSISETAEILGVARMTVYRYIKKGILQTVTMPGGTVRVKRSSIEAMR